MFAGDPHAGAFAYRDGTLEAGQAFNADVNGRLAWYGRAHDQLVVLPAATFVVGDTDADAHEKAAVIRRKQVSGQSAIKFAEQFWNRDLSGYDPEGHCPKWIRYPVRTRSRAEGRASGCTVTPSPPRVSGREINHLVQQDASDGFILVPHVTPGGLDEFADAVVPLLQERGVFRSDYEGVTLRDHLGIGSSLPGNLDRSA